MPLDNTTLNNFYIKNNVNLDFENWLEKKGKKIFAKLGYLKVHISKGSGKLLDIDSISTNTLTNEFCQKQHNKKIDTICKNCYSFALLQGIRKNMQDCLERNSQLLSESLLPDSVIPFIMQKYLRIASHGENINMTHVVNIFNIIRKNPTTIFAYWTKRTDLINEYFRHFKKPSNVIMVYSNPKKNHILKKIPKNFNKTFNNVHKDKFIDQQNCTGQKCKDCMACYNFNNINVIVEKVKKY
tara:strand:- start:487 stop:1209 length:723 start_codon:yes stop_codon:yes gene_type:complete